MTRIALAKENLERALAFVQAAIGSLDQGDPREAGDAVFKARGHLGLVKTTLEDELRFANLRLEALETERLKRSKIGGTHR